jgi:hypothetical protein
MITPFKLFLALFVVLVTCYLLDNDKGNKNRTSKVGVVGGLTFLSMILDIIWGIFYYINI